MWQQLIQTLSAFGIIVTAFWTMFLAIFAGCAVLYAAKQFKALRKQLEHTSEATLTSLSNQHNWVSLEHWEDMPPALPSWFELKSKSDWAWRVLHFNHLNLLKLFWRDSTERRLATESEIAAWVKKGKFYFQSFRSDDENFQRPEIQRGLETLRQVLRPEEGYPKEFIRWLRERGILPETLFDHGNV